MVSFFYFYYMKRIFVGSLSLLVIGLGACSKKYTCVSRTIYIRPVDILFSGFDSSEIDTLVIKITQSTNDSLLLTDTLITRPVLTDGVFWPDSNSFQGFTAIKLGINIQIHLTSINRTINLSDVREGVKETYYEIDAPCGPGASHANVAFPLDIKVDGIPVSPVSLPEIKNSKYIIIAK